MRRSWSFLALSLMIIAIGLILDRSYRSSSIEEFDWGRSESSPEPEYQEFSLDEIADLFPSRGYEERVDFWRSVFAVYGAADNIFHDRKNVGLVYEVVSFEQSPYQAPAEERNRQTRVLENKKKEIESILGDLARQGSQAEKLSPRHRAMATLLKEKGYTLNSSTLRELQENIRYQRGIKERFAEGIVRSGRYLAFMEEVFERHGVPTELTLLPHIESSFNYRAYSKVGAAGLWQFMPATARQFIQVGELIDQRLNPYQATEAAAQYLKANYRTLGNWPLAITAYNHGRTGIARAKAQHGPDLLDIIENYRSNIFGFASQNFYVEFLAAIEVVKNYPKYFGELELERPLQYEVVRIQRGLHLSHLRDISVDVLRDYNPELTPSVWRRQMLPSGFDLRIPLEQAQTLSSVIAQAMTQPPPQQARQTTQRLQPTSRKVVHRVRSGENLYTIARKHGVSTQSIQRANNIRNPSRIYPGQVLAITK